MARSDTTAAGFTLLELMVAIVVFAVMAALAYGGLRSVVTGREVVSRHAEELARLQLALTILGRDLEQVVARPIRAGLGETLPALGYDAAVEPYLELSRVTEGIATPRLERVGYRLEGGVLIRESWPTLDRTAGTEPRKRELLSGITALELRFLDADDNWSERWPPDAEEPTATALPRAVELILETSPWGELRRVWEVAAAEL